MARLMKHVGNAGDEPLVLSYPVEGVEQTWTIPPHCGVDVPISDADLQEIEEQAAAVAAAQ